MFSRQIYLIITIIISTNYFCENLTAMHQFTSTSPICNPFRGEFCVNLSECKYFVNLMNRTPLPRPRAIIRLIQCGFNYDMSPMVCCTHPPLQTNIFTRHSENRKLKNVELLPRNCGGISVAGRITQGTESALMEFPWMALLVYQDDDDLDFHCAGTLINERYVLTAAHCVSEQDVVGVRIGEHDISTTEDCDKITGICSPPVQDFLIENIIVHPEYNSKTFLDDIALIRLATSANLTYENARAVCLPIGEYEQAALDGAYAFITGWGVTEKGSKSIQLLKTQIPIRNIGYCRQIYRGRTLITGKQLCAGGKDGKNSCRGDSGGPLMTICTAGDGGGAKFVQHGIVSFGPRWCAMKTQPRVYTSVGGYVQWILESLRP